MCFPGIPFLVIFFVVLLKEKKLYRYMTATELGLFSQKKLSLAITPARRRCYIIMSGSDQKNGFAIYLET